MKNFLANILAAAMGGAILWSVLQAWLDGLDSKLWVTLGAAAAAAVVGLAWKRISPALRPLLVGTCFVLLVGGLSLLHGPSATEAYRIGDLSLAGLVNLLILGSGAVALVGSIRKLPMPPKAQGAVGCLGALLLSPFGYGLVVGDSLTELLAGPGALHILPVYGRPAVLAIVLLLPLSVLVLLRDVLRARRDEEREVLGPLLLLLCAFVPLVVGVSALLGTGTPGLALRVFSEHDWDSLHSQTVSAEPKLTWEEPPEGLSSPRFWMEWEGSLQVQESGQHRFGLFGEGTTGHVYIDGYLAADGLEESDYIPLELGSHRIRVGLVSKAPEGTFELLWTTPGEGDFVPIPRALLTHSKEDLDWSRTPRQAAQVGLEWLQSLALRWQRYHGCFGCHVQAQAVMGMSVGQDSGYVVNDAVLRELAGFMRKEQGDDGSWHKADVAATQFAAMALAWIGRDGAAPRDAELRDGLEFLTSKQVASGEFPVNMREAPIMQGSMMTTSNTLFSLRSVEEEGASGPFGSSAKTAFEWLLQAEVETTQDAAMQLLAISREAPALPLKQSRMDFVVSQQEADGGWKETPETTGSSAFSTGQVLYGLKVAGQPVGSPEFGAGVRFLMQHQQVSGEWKAMHTLSARRSDFAPTMWAVIGLAGSYDRLTPDVIAPRLDVEEEIAARVPEVQEAQNEGDLVVAGDSDAIQVEVPLDVVPDVSSEIPAETFVEDEPEGLAIEIVLPSDGVQLSGLVTCKARLHAAAETPLKLVGFYLGTERLAERAVSADSGWSEVEMDCNFTDREPGEYTLTAVVQDRASNRAMVQHAVQIVGSGSEGGQPPMGVAPSRPEEAEAPAQEAPVLMEGEQRQDGAGLPNSGEAEASQ